MPPLLAVYRWLGISQTTTSRAATLQTSLLSKSHRVPWWVRKAVQINDAVALRAAVQLGITTKAANEHVTIKLDASGNAVGTKVRDSEGCTQAKRKSVKRKRGSTTKEGEAAESQEPKRARNMEHTPSTAENCKRKMRKQKRSS